MLAIPVLRSRVAPVLNWCSRIQIFPEEPSQEDGAQELILPQLAAVQRLHVLRENGVNTLICGALSADLLRDARGMGLAVVSGVAGEVQAVVQSYWRNSLDLPEFWLPGCRGLSGYRSGQLKGPGLPCHDQSRPRNGARLNRPSGPPPGPGLGPGGCCRCPACGLKVPHEQGIPCVHLRCPRCSQVMERL
jgi:predicted Fe-Mo cluster-binding NifX family protein